MSIAESISEPLAGSAEGTRALGADTTPGHLVRLLGTNWNLWRTVVVRGAGFPAEMVQQIAARRAAAAADHYLACRARAARQADAALRRLKGELGGSRESYRQLRVARAAILAGKPEAVGDNAEAVAAARACAEAETARKAYVEDYTADRGTINNSLIAMSQEPRFREAMLWQSADSTRRIWHDLRPDVAASVRQRALRQVAMRVQRYCVKNDSIGFFGPVGWATIEDQPERITVTPGPGLLAYREVFFEGWSIDALAASLDTREIRPWIAPRVKSGVWVRDLIAYQPQRKEVVLTARERAVLVECDGTRTAMEVSEAVRERGALSNTSQEEEVIAILERLVAVGIVVWRLEVAPQLHPERELAARLARIGDAQLRGQCMAALDEIMVARDRVAKAADSDGELDKALELLEESFTRLTAQSSSRRGGRTYAGRTLVYEDCRRDCEVHIGTRFMEDMAQPLGIVLDSARWAAAEVGSVMRKQMRSCLAELKQEQRGEEIDCHLFSEYVILTVWPPNKPCTLFEGAMDVVQERWGRVLGKPLKSSSSRASFPVEEVRARARDIFPPREPGWSLGRYVSPDLMIAAASTEAIRRGEYRGVLGEIHSGNSMTAFLSMHSDAQQLLDALDEDTSCETAITRQRPKSMWLARINHDLVLPRYWRYQFSDDLPNHPPCRPLPAGKLVVKDTGSSVAVKARDGSIQFDALELFAGPLVDDASRIITEFRPRLPHMPRLSLGNLVIARERWNMSPKDMPFLREMEAAQQFLEVRAWARSLGMPRRVFVTSPIERKPWFLDFDSPVLTAIFVWLIRKVPEEALVKVVEMLPDLADMWLEDAEGQRFASELRLVAREVPASSN